jgi:hypothetical protein
MASSGAGDIILEIHGLTKEYPGASSPSTRADTA